MTPLAPRLNTYSALDSSDTIAMALAPEAATGCTPNTPSPPDAPQISTLSPGLSVCGAWRNSMREAEASVSVEQADSSRVRCGGFGISCRACTRQNCANEP